MSLEFEVVDDPARACAALMVSAAIILIGNGDGTCQPQVRYASGLTPIWVSAGDPTGDGKLAVTNPAPIESQRCCQIRTSAPNRLSAVATARWAPLIATAVPFSTPAFGGVRSVIAISFIAIPECRTYCVADLARSA